MKEIVMLEGNNFPTWAIVVICVVAVIVLLIVIVVAWWISTSNKLKRMIVKIDESSSGIDVALTKRSELINKQVAIVKGYMEHEKETLLDVVSQRNGNEIKTLDMQKKVELNNELDNISKNINVVVERYPDLKANTNFMSLQNTAIDVEEQLQASRRIYNSNVSKFNQNIVSFPTSIVANHLKLTSKNFFEASATQKEDPTISFK